MFESRISEGATEKLPGWEKLQAKTIAWSYDMEGHLKKCVERCCELANKKVEQLHKVSSLCIDDHQFKKEELGSVGELSEVCFCIKMHVFGENWTTRHSLVSQQFGSCSHQMALNQHQVQFYVYLEVEQLFL